MSFRNSTQTLPSWVFTFDRHDDGDNVEVPEDLSTFDDEALQTLSVDLQRTFNAIRGEALTRASLDELNLVAAGIERVKNELERRKTEREELTAEAEQLAAQVGVQDPEPDDEPDDDEEESDAETNDADVDVEVTETGDTVITETPTESVAASTTATTPTAPTPPQRVGTLSIRKRGINVPMDQVRRNAPDPQVAAQSQQTMVIVAPDVPNHVAGRPLDDLEALANAVHRRAKTLSNPSGNCTVATIRQDFPIVLDREAGPDEIWNVVNASRDPANLVAAGGWCAPSTIIYDFFNVVCDDGMVDLPTVGVTRGGIRFPTSPSIADTLDDIWLWTQANDIAATGGTPTKPCVRVPCPSFNEEILDCHGLCVTAGNLTEAAYPELIRNYLRLVMSAHRHVINQRLIADMVALSVAVTGGPAAQPITTNLLGAIGLQAVDYRERYRMCENDPLEIVLPRWTKEAIRSDVAKRTGVENMLAVSDAQMMDWFNQRMVRVQFVSDWQLGSGDDPGQSTPRTAWPSDVQFMLYAAGTFIRGNGLDLDLGVVRDSTLNATNDHTAAWTEECMLVARVGHESRLVSVPFCVDGNTGAANIDSCAVV